MSFFVFFYVVYSCLGVFGMIRNGLYGLTLVGSAYSESFYWLALPVVIIAVTVSLFVVVKGAIGVPVATTSVPLFLLGLVVYLFSVTALGIMLATLVRSMPQFGLLAFPTFIAMSLLSGGQTPLESMPIALQKIMQFVPSTHFVSFSQAVLFRNASPSMVWWDLTKMFLIGVAYTAFTLTRFRKMLTAIQ